MFIRLLYDDYISVMIKRLKQNPELLQTFPGFLVSPTKIIIYFGKTHIVVEYEGPERISAIPSDVGKIFCQSVEHAEIGVELFDEIIGFPFGDATSGFRLPLCTTFEDLILPTNRGLDQLVKLGWNFEAQDTLMTINGGGLTLVEGQFARIVNGFFFDASERGLITRHIKWADCFPINRVDCGEIWKIGFPRDQFKDLAVQDRACSYHVPEDYRFQRLQRINRFIEFYSAPKRTEPEITALLGQEDFRFLLTMRFGCINIISQPLLEWQSEARDAIKPDFILVQPGGSGDICEFKLPHFKSGAVVGRHNRETFSAEINSYVSQTRVYQEYFDDPNNCRWVEEKFGIKVYKPTRYLIAGARSDLKRDERRHIESDHRDLRILSYEDLVDGVVAQFYQ